MWIGTFWLELALGYGYRQDFNLYFFSSGEGFACCDCLLVVLPFGSIWLQFSRNSDDVISQPNIS